MGFPSYRHAKSTRYSHLPERGTPEGPASDAGAGWLAVEVPRVGSATPSMASSHASCSSENGGESRSIRSSLVGNTPGWHEQEPQLRLLKDRRTAQELLVLLATQLLAAHG